MKMPRPLRDYENLMLMIKRRLMFIEEHNDKKVDFLKVELIGVQLRKIVEAVSYSCMCACELGAAELEIDLLRSYKPREIFEKLAQQQLDFVPQPRVVKVRSNEDSEIIDWNISDKKLDRSKLISTALGYVKLYKKLAPYAHEFHPRRGHHMLHKDGLERSVSILGAIKTKLTNSLWQHFIPCGNRALVVDFGQKDIKPPEVYVFRSQDESPAWPILFAIGAPVFVNTSARRPGKTHRAD